MPQPNYIIEEVEGVLHIHYKVSNNYKRGHAIWHFFKSYVFFPLFALLFIYFCIIGWLKMYDIVLAARSDWGGRIPVIALISIVIGIVVLSSSLSFLKDIRDTFKDLYNRQFHPNLHCIVKKGSIVQKNLNPKITDSKQFEIKAETINSIYVVIPDSYEKYFQIEIYGEVGIKRLDLCIDGDRQKAAVLLEKIKIYLY